MHIYIHTYMHALLILHAHVKLSTNVGVSCNAQWPLEVSPMLDTYMHTYTYVHQVYIIGVTVIWRSMKSWFSKPVVFFFGFFSLQICDHDSVSFTKICSLSNNVRTPIVSVVWFHWEERCFVYDQCHGIFRFLKYSLNNSIRSPI